MNTEVKRKSHKLLSLIPRSNVFGLYVDGAFLALDCNKLLQRSVAKSCPYEETVLKTI